MCPVMYPSPHHAVYLFTLGDHDSTAAERISRKEEWREGIERNASGVGGNEEGMWSRKRENEPV